MSIWLQFNQLVRRFFPNRYAQVFFYAGLAVAFIASPTREKLVYFGFETLPGIYYYIIGGCLILIGIILARLLPRRQFRSVGEAIKYWVEREGGLDYAAYYNDLPKLKSADPYTEPAEEYFHDTQLENRSNTLSIKDLSKETLQVQWRTFTAQIHRKVAELDATLEGAVLGVNEKIAFDTVMGGIYYWRLSYREVLVAMTIDQRSVDNRYADDEFTSIGEAILDLTSRRRGKFN